MSKHTSGPWSVGAHTNHEQSGAITIDCAGPKIGSVRYSANRSIDEAKANARAISAVPELLDAAELFVSWVDSGDDGFPDEELLDRAVKTGRKAIAKAEGD